MPAGECGDKVPRRCTLPESVVGRIHADLNATVTDALSVADSIQL
jgi:hypothetical protein